MRCLKCPRTALPSWKFLPHELLHLLWPCWWRWLLRFVRASQCDLYSSNHRTLPTFFEGVRLIIWQVQYMQDHNLAITSYNCINMYRYCVRPSAMLGLGQWVEQCNLIMLDLKLCPMGHLAKYIYIYICFSPFSHLRLPFNAFHLVLVLLLLMWYISTNSLSLSSLSLLSLSLIYK